MWKQSSKYKHAVPKSAKLDAAYTDVRVAQTASDSSHGLKVNPKHVAFASGTGVGGGVISVLPWGAPGKYDKETAVLSGHAGGITDLDFSPFDDDVLASGSDDATVKVWRIPAGGLTETISSPLASLSCSKRVEAVKFNPSADGVLATAAGAEVRVWNVSQGGEPTSQLVDGHTDLVHSISWKSDGTLLASSSKDKKLRVLDPRANTVVAVGDGHTGIKASLVQWLGNKDRFISTGFSKMRDREFALWDMRNLASPLARESLDTSTGILLPLYDEDANLIFFTGKGDASVRWFELLDDKGKYFSWPGTPAVIDTPHKGVTLVPKRALDVMSGEVDCMLRSTQAGLVPLSFIVPRKSYTVFLDDVFPDTRSTVAGNSAAQWFAGEDGEVPLMSLDPDRRGSAPAAVQQPVEAASSQADAGAAAAAVPEPTPVAAPVAAPAVAMPTPTVVIEPAAPSPAPSESSLPSRTATPSSAAVSGVPSRTATPSSTTSSYKSIVRVSSYRYMSGKVMHPSNNYDHLKDLAIKMGGESNVLHASERFLAVPLSKPGGQVGIIPVEQTGRQPTKLHAVVNGAELLDLAFDPFDPYVLATATDDGSIRIWRIPEGGLTEDVATPVRRMIGHQHRVNLIRYHPLAKDIIISASPELSEPTVRLWNTATGEEVGKLAGFQDLVFDVSVSYDGALIAVVSKDKKIRVFDARSGELLQTGPSHEGVRGCRVVWLGKTGRIATIGADRSSNREIRVYDADNLAAGALSTTQMDISPGVLVPYYDEDTKVLFLWGRGDTSTSFYEMTDEKPFCHYLTRFDAGGLQIGQTFMPKRVVNVRDVEVARAYRLTQDHIEKLTFSIPRARPEFFQDDVYPPTRVADEPAISAADWLAGGMAQLKLQDLCPDDMTRLSQAPPVEVKAKKYESREKGVMSEIEVREAVMDNMFSSMRDKSDAEILPQDLKEGVPDSDWDD